MFRAIKLSFLKDDDRDPKAIVDFVMLLDQVLRMVEVDPIIWECQEVIGPSIRWGGYIPEDCRAAFDEVSEGLVNLIKERAKRDNGELRIKKNS